jgi:hypothetical protein
MFPEIPVPNVPRAGAAVLQVYPPCGQMQEQAYPPVHVPAALREDPRHAGRRGHHRHIRQVKRHTSSKWTLVIYYTSYTIIIYEYISSGIRNRTKELHLSLSSMDVVKSD